MNAYDCYSQTVHTLTDKHLEYLLPIYEEMKKASQEGKIQIVKDFSSTKLTFKEICEILYVLRSKDFKIDRAFHESPEQIKIYGDTKEIILVEYTISWDLIRPHL